MKIGYIRVGIQEQNIAWQEVLMQELDVDEIHIDQCSEKNIDRLQLKKMLSYVTKGDTVIVESISRFARNSKYLLELVETLSNKEVIFVSKKEAIDTNTPTEKFMLTIFGAVAELEWEYLLQRQQEGIAIAKTRRVYKERKPIEYSDFDRIVKKLRQGDMTASTAIKQLSMSKSSFYRKLQLHQFW